MSKELIKVVAQGGHITNYVHLALQSGDNEVLKNMNRKYTREKYIQLVKKVKKYLSDCFLATDVLVGFPNESYKQFLNTVKLFKLAKFDMAYINKYSPRAGTVSARMADNVTKAEKKRREFELNKVLSQIALANNKKLLGRQIRVLIDGRAKDGQLIGKDFGYRSVKVASNKNLIGHFVDILVTKANNFGLEGELL